MNNIFKSKKSVIIIILVGLSLVSVLFIISSTNTKKAPSPAPLTSSVANWNGLTPGVSSQNDVTNKLGKPKMVSGSTLSFNSQNPNFNNQVVIDGGVASFFKEYIVPAQKRNSDEITSKFGVAQNVLYGPDSINGFYLFVYPSNGIAYIGNPNTKDVLEIWYFKPTTIDDFMNKWGSEYSQQQQNGAGY